MSSHVRFLGINIVCCFGLFRGGSGFRGLGGFSALSKGRLIPRSAATFVEEPVGAGPKFGERTGCVTVVAVGGFETLSTEALNSLGVKEGIDALTPALTAASDVGLNSLVGVDILLVSGVVEVVFFFVTSMGSDILLVNKDAEAVLLCKTLFVPIVKDGRTK